MPAFDLQAHSRHSDGVLEAAEVVDLAHAAGVELFALTDHDTVDGVPEAAARARELGMRYSPASELSAVHGGHEDLHVLGYELDVADPGLRATLEDFRGDRARRIEAMADRLRELGFELDDAPLRARRDAGKPIGRPHLADAVLAHPANAQRLRDEGIHGKNELFPPYLVPGAAAYVARSRPTVPEAIDVIHAAGGVAVWAHPFWDVDAPEEALRTLEEFVGAGLDGVECFYPTHTEEQTRLLHDVAVRHGLLTTGSTDFHGPEHDRFSGFLGFGIHGLSVNLGRIGGNSGYQGVP
jgi:predicted metal-dependent phosphoesterase TrpH